MRGVLTLAGEGTRMLPWTRGLRKEFLPLYDRSGDHAPVLKPVAHHVLETLVDAGATDITLVVGAKDRAFVQQYFTIDRPFLTRHAHHADRLQETERFYDTLGRLKLKFVVQPAPRGFGDAVWRARRAVGNEPFLLHAADAVLLEPSRGRLLRRMAARRDREDLDAVLLVRHVADPRRYGVVEGRFSGREDTSRVLTVSGMQEKPERPRSAWAATAVYAFSPRVFHALAAVAKTDHPRELEVTDAIRWMLGNGGRVEALVLKPTEGTWRSVGSPDGYLRALKDTQRRTQGPTRTPTRR
ncbi:MAG: NTP transferase domain-containing protein [Thermoplasmata archaeon]|nr:NTP transferase domain-containing protein [Thermoplasmata archaeon]